MPDDPRPAKLPHYDRTHWEGIAIAAGDYDPELNRLLAFHGEKMSDSCRRWTDWELRSCSLLLGPEGRGYPRLHRPRAAR